MVEKKVNRKRKLTEDGSGDENDDDDSTSPLSYTYTHCDSSEILQEMEQQQQESLMMYQSQRSVQIDDDDDDSTLGIQRQPPTFRWLTWRMDPIKSFSDWTIDVYIFNRKSTGDGTTIAAQPSLLPTLPQQNGVKVLDETNELEDENNNYIHNNAVSVTQQQRYHVHRNILVVESQFFQTLLHQRPTTTATDSVAVAASPTTTDITLSNELEGQVFPTFLDYMYSPSSVWINAHNVRTMLLMARYFGMKRLQWLCKLFLKIEASQQPANHTCTTEAISPNVSSFQQRMTNLSRIAGSNGDMLLAYPTPETPSQPAAGVKDTSDRFTDKSTRSQQPLDPITTVTTRRRPQKIRGTGLHHHNHISTNSSTTTATALSEHVTATTATTKPSKTNDGYY